MTLRMFDVDTMGADLIVTKSRREIEHAAQSGAMVVTAPPGTGKTTVVPPLIANLVGTQAGGRTLVTQPRRVAVRAAARRLAALDGSPLGDAVGYTVRGERKLSDDTRIEVVTPGVLLRRVLADPGLEGIGAVILDEVHERSVDIDLLLGMISEARVLREDLIVVAMSATLDAERVASVLGADAGSGPVRIVTIPSALYPLKIDYEPFSGARLNEYGVTREYLAHLASVTASAQAKANTDALVFLPGAYEVDAVVQLLRERVSLDLDVLPLHGRLSPTAQDLAVQGRGDATRNHRIVVSTALAESSLTVPGVHLVIDSGLAREIRRDRAREITGLVTVSAARSSAEQRAGRAARQGPGKAIRVYSEAEHARMRPAPPPEIVSTDLVDAALTLAAWGAPGGRGMTLPTEPPASEMARAESILQTLDLVDAEGRATPSGVQVSRLPMGVREARALTAGTSLLSDPHQVAEIVAALSTDLREPGADLSRLLSDLRSGRSPQAKRWRHESDRFERIAHELSSLSFNASTLPETHAAGIVTALARPEWIARRVGNAAASTYVLASGTRAALPPSSGLIGSEWIAVREMQRSESQAAQGTGAIIRLAARLTEIEVLQLGASLTKCVRASRIDGHRVRVREIRKLGAITLSETPVAPGPSDVAPAFATHIRERGLGALHWTETAHSLRNRLALLQHELGDPWPEVTEAALLRRISEWLDPDLTHLKPNQSLSSIDVTSALRRLLPWPESSRLDELAPERLRLPSGSTARIEYAAPIELDPTRDEAGATAHEATAPPPIIAAKLQELFGLGDTPKLVDGRVPVLFHLLSPARRPLAITDDLASFWNGPYHDVRREMRGRYPKHPWPEDPWSEPATARTKRRDRS